MPYDLFISYSHKDNERGQVRELCDAIGDDFQQFAGRGLRVFFDEHDIPSMADWEARIAQGLRESRLFLAVLSPNYFASDYCRREWEEYIRYEATRQCLGEGVAPVYFVELPGPDGAGVDQSIAEWVTELRKRQWCDLASQKPLKIVRWHDAGKRALEDVHVAQRLESLRSEIKERLNRADRARQSPTNIYRHNPQFVGRVRELTLLREALNERGSVGVVGHKSQPPSASAATAVHGLGGMGKTELALAYAHAFAWDYPGGRWLVRCEGLDNFDLVLRQLAEPLGVEFTEDEQKDPPRASERILAELRRRDRSLLLLDNVTHPELVGPDVLMRLPSQGHVHFLATTRLGPAQLAGSPHDHTFVVVDELPDGDALALIRAHQPDARFGDPDDEAAANALVGLLAGFTLAVETAAIYLGRHAAAPRAVAAYTSRLRRELLSESEASAADAAVAVRHKEKLLERTLAITFETLSAEQLHLLKLAALLPADQVALLWLRAVASEEYSALKPEAGADADGDWQKLTDLLLSLRLFQSGGDARVVRMHRLVQELIKKREPEDVANLETALLVEIKSRAEFLLEGWIQPDHRWESAPLVACAWQWMDRASLEGSWLANSVVAGPLLHLAKFAEAEPLMRRALDVDLQHFDQYDPRAVTSLLNLAAVLLETNHPSEAEPLMRRAVANREQSFGPDHPSLVDPLGSLASLLETTNRLAEAEPLRRRALAIAERSFGPDSRVVGDSLGNLATSLLQGMTRFVEAESLMRRALAILEQSLGPYHPKVARSLNDLARLLQVTDCLAEAETLMRRALAIEERCFGVDDPNLATRLNNLASLLANTNRLAEAELLLRRALAFDEQKYGPDHPNVADSLNNLGSVLERMKRCEQAEPLIRRGLRIREQSFGPYHPKVAESLDNLATLPQYAHQPAAAEPLLRRALVIRETSLGYDHPEVAASLNNLALLLEATNRAGEAEALMRRSLAIEEQSHGLEHPRVAIVLANLAGLIEAANRPKEAEPLRRRVMEIFLRSPEANGRPHEDLPSAIQRYANSLKKNGRNQEDVLAQLNEVGRPFGMRFGV